MGSECMSLPVIDLSNLKQGTPGWQTAKTRVVEALQEIGVFEATFDDIPRPLGQAVINGMKQMFDLPLEVKLRNKSSKPYGGYIRQPIDALFESMGIEDADLPGKVDGFTNLLWPDGNPAFRDNIVSLSEKLRKMERMIRRIVVEGLGVEKYMDDHLDSTEYLVRFQKYDAPETEARSRVGMPAHTDNSYVTILYQNEVRGLEVQTKDGRWFTAEPSLNSCIVFIGDTYHAWTNGRLHSPNHRVMLKGDEDRYSVGVFSRPKEGYTVESPEELVDEDHPLLFKPFDHHKFLEEADWSAPEALKKYCGV